MTRVFKGTLGFEKGCMRKGPGSMERGAQGRGMGEGCGVWGGEGVHEDGHRGV